ncbi:MAG: hypothetical protein WDO68_17710 [Gammaproteobacteria bacterium]
MMERHILKSILGATGIALVVVLAACDNAPDPNFEQNLKQAKQADDPYADLGTVPRQANYVRTEASLKQASASQEALNLRARYESLLKKLDADKSVAAANLLASCRPSFAEAVAFQADDKVDGQTARSAGNAVFQGLMACREHALSAEKEGNATAKASAPLLRRFASTGMVLVGVATIAHGDEAAGLALWRQGDGLAAQDKPAFKIKPDMFRP